MAIVTYDCPFGWGAWLADIRDGCVSPQVLRGEPFVHSRVRFSFVRVRHSKAGEILLFSGTRTVQDTIHNLLKLAVLHAITAKALKTGSPSPVSPSILMVARAVVAERPLEKSFQAVA
jgi:hypothetical protein